MNWSTRDILTIESISELAPTLQAIAATMYDWTQANYILSYCSDSRSGSHTVSLGLTEGQGMLESRFSAEGFTEPHVGA